MNLTNINQVSLPGILAGTRWRDKGGRAQGGVTDPNPGGHRDGGQHRAVRTDYVNLSPDHRDPPQQARGAVGDCRIPPRTTPYDLDAITFTGTQVGTRWVPQGAGPITGASSRGAPSTSAAPGSSCGPATAAQTNSGPVESNAWRTSGGCLTTSGTTNGSAVQLSTCNGGAGKELDGRRRRIISSTPASASTPTVPAAPTAPRSSSGPATAAPTNTGHYHLMGRSTRWPECCILTGDATEELDPMLSDLPPAQEQPRGDRGRADDAHDENLVVHDFEPGWDASRLIRPRLPATWRSADVRPEDYDALVIPGGRARNTSESTRRSPPRRPVLLRAGPTRSARSATAPRYRRRWACCEVAPRRPSLH